MISPTDMDVLCGKNKDCVNFPGSIRLREIVESFAHRYRHASSKFEKMEITKTIYDKVRETSRFLKYNETTEVWEEITMMAARDKIGHSLRFAGRAKRRVKKQTKQSSSSSCSISSSESEQPQVQVQEDKIFSSLLGQMKQGIFGPEDAIMPETTMPSLNQALSMLESQGCKQADDDQAFYADDLITLLNQDLSATKDTCDALNGFADDIRQVIQKIDAEKASEDTFHSLMSEPLGEWEGDDGDDEVSPRPINYQQ